MRFWFALVLVACGSGAEGVEGVGEPEGPTDGIAMVNTPPEPEGPPDRIAIVITADYLDLFGRVTVHDLDDPDASIELGVLSDVSCAKPTFYTDRKVLRIEALSENNFSWYLTRELGASSCHVIHLGPNELTSVLNAHVTESTRCPPAEITLDGRPLGTIYGNWKFQPDVDLGMDRDWEQTVNYLFDAAREGKAVVWGGARPSLMEGVCGGSGTASFFAETLEPMWGQFIQVTG